jgi:hypothetical protein
VICTLSHWISIFYMLTGMKFHSIGYFVFIPLFLCLHIRQRAPSPPISPILGDGDAAATRISGGDGRSKLGSLRGVITEVMTHNTSHTIIKHMKCSES